MNVSVARLTEDLHNICNIVTIDGVAEGLVGILLSTLCGRYEKGAEIWDRWVRGGGGWSSCQYANKQKICD